MTKVLFADGRIKTIVSAVEDSRGNVWFVDTLGKRHPSTAVITYTKERGH